MPLLAETVSADVAVPLAGTFTGVTLNDAPIPVEEAAAVKLTEQQKPLMLDSVTVVLVDDPT